MSKRPVRRWSWIPPLVVIAGVALGIWTTAARHPAAPVSPVAREPAGRAPSAGTGSRLPVEAQSLISSTLGAADERFAPVRREGGFALDAGRITAALGRGGIRVGGAGADLALRLAAIGRSGRLRQLPAVTPSVRAHRVVYARGAGVLEWYAGGPLGLEQGFTLARPPAGGSGAVRLALAVSGLRTRLRAGAGATFLTRSGRVAFRYGGLAARDARGRRLPAWLSLSGSRLVLGVADRGARYPLRIDPFVQQGPKLVANDANGGAGLGGSVAVSADGNTALVGGAGDNNNVGAAWVFTRSGGTWTQQGPKLTAGDESGSGWFGSSAALSTDGNTALIGGTNDGSSGAAWVFTRSGSTWTQQGSKLTSSAQVSFGTSVALSADGNTALIGAPDDSNNAGTAWAFTRSGTTWTQQGSALTGGGESGQGNFGGSVALSGDGDTALVGGLADNNSVGAAWSFTFSGSVWAQLGPKLTASDESGAGGFGGSVALSGDGRTAVIGANNDGTNGAAWIFARESSFTQQGPKLVPTDASGPGADFGTSVALSADGGTALIGGVGDDGAVGAAWVFAVGTQTQQGPKLTASDASGQANVGASVALSGDGSTALVGANGDNRGAGAAWAFATNNQVLYWDNPQAGAIGRDNGPPSQVDQSFISGLEATHRKAIATDNQHVYWSEGGFIARANLDGSGINRQFIGANAGAIAVDAQHVYWITSFSDSIGRADLDGSGAQDQFITVAGGLLSGLAVDGGHVYWKDQRQRSIGRANLDGSGIDDTFITGAGTSDGAVAVDAQHVYWTDITGASAPFVGEIGRANIDGTGATPNFITGAAEPSGLAVNGSSIYWANYYNCNNQTDPPTSCGGGTIGRANLDGSGVNETFATAEPRSGPGCGTNPETRCGPSAVALATLPDGSVALYWDNPQVGAIARETIDGSAGNVNQSLVTGIGQLFHVGVAVDRQHLYWTNGSSVGRSGLDGSGVEQQFIHVAPPAQHVAVDDQYVYWSSPGGIGRAKLDGSDITDTFISLTGDDVGGLAVDAAHIYWTEGAHGTIGRANLDGTGVNSSFITGTPNATDVAVDGLFVYWTQLVGTALPPAGSIGRANLDGTGANPSFITGAADPSGITVGYSHIYWANYYDCDNHTDPPSACAGGTIGRANLDGTGVNQSYVTADQSAGPGCNTTPQTRCGPSSVAVSAPTQPDCLRSATTPAPPPGGAVFAQPLDQGSSNANVVVIPAGVSWTGPASCAGVAQGSDQVMTHPSTISVAPDAAVLLHDAPAGLVSAWGARNVGAGDPAPVLFPGRSDWQTTEADLITPQALLQSEDGCPVCVLPTGTDLTPTAPSADVAYQGDVDHAVMNGATLSGSFNGWNFSGAGLAGSAIGSATSGVQVNRADFAGADLRGAQLTSLQFTEPPSFANVRIGALGSACTQFSNTNLVETGFTAVAADVLVPGCANSPLLPQSTAPLDLINQLSIVDGATVDYANAQFLVTAANHAVLAGADLDGINLSGASFVGFPADLENTTFNGATLQNTIFQLADLAGAKFLDAVAPGVSFEDANLNGATFAQATEASPRTNLKKADFVDADVSNASFQSADISGAVFDNALANQTDLNSVVATGTRFDGAHIYGMGEGFETAIDLSGASFVGAVLVGSEDGSEGFNFNGAPLANAHFENAQCVACNFTGASLNDATFTDADLPGVELPGVSSLTGASFHGAWLYCGTTSSGTPSDAGCTPSGAPGPQWSLALGSQETYGPVPFNSTKVTSTQFMDVTLCPDGTTPGAAGCSATHLVPSGTLPAPPCSAVALDACTTPTSTLFDATKPPSSEPLSVVPAVPPTWSTAVTGRGYYVGLTDGTVRQVGFDSQTTDNRIVAGSAGAHCPSPTDACGDGGAATSAQLGTPAGLAMGLDGSLYIADPTLHRVRRIDPSGTITTVAGSGQVCSSPSAACGDGGQATAAALGGPDGVWSSPSGELFIADGSRGVREVASDGTITTLDTSAVPKSTFVSIVGDSTGSVYAATNDPDYLVQIDPTGAQPATIVVGTGTSGFNGSTDSSGDPLPGTQVQIDQPGALSVALNGDVLFADTANNLIRAYVPSAGTLIEVGGTISSSGVPEGGFNDGQPADQTLFEHPAAVTATRGALVVVADTGNSLLRQFGPNPPSAQLGGGLGGPQPPPPSDHRPNPPVTTPSVGHPPPHLGHVHHRLPNNHVAISRITTHRDGTLSFSVALPGPGAIDVLATAWNDNLARAAVHLRPAPRRFVYARAHASARRAVTLHLEVTPNARGRRLVRHHTYPVTLRLWVSYTPTGGRSRSRGLFGLRIPS